MQHIHLNISVTQLLHTLEKVTWRDRVGVGLTYVPPSLLSPHASSHHWPVVVAASCAGFALIGWSSQVPGQCLLLCRGSPCCPQTRPDTKFRGCLPLPGVVQHLPVAAATPSEGGKLPFWSGVINVLEPFVLRTIRTPSPEQSELYKCVKTQQTLHSRVSPYYFCILCLHLLPIKIESSHGFYSDFMVFTG